MRKSTLVKGGSAALLCAMAFYGLSPMLNAADPYYANIKAPWYKTVNSVTQWEDEGGLVTESMMKLTERVNVHDHWIANSTSYGNYESLIDFTQMGAGVMNGVFATFLNVDPTSANYQKPFTGKYLEMDYSEIKNHEIMNTAEYMKFTDEKGNTGLGIYQNQNASARVDFVYSTKGLTGVESVELDVRAFGNTDLVNRKIDWTFDVYVYNLDGSFVSQMVSDRAIFTAKNHTIGERHLTHVKASVSDADNQNPNSWQQGSLDNKIIIVMLRGAKSVEDPESDTGSSDTEPLTVFTNARLAFTRPDVAFGAANTKVFEAGAGRNTSCAPDTLVTNVEFWNTLYKNNYSKTNNVYTDKFSAAFRDGLYEADQDAAPQEELAYYELNVEYPFIADKMEVSKESNLAEVDGWVSLDAMFEADKIGRKGTPGVDKKVTYLIPREYFVQTDATDDRDCKSSARFTYYFAPQEVKAFDKDDYIWSTITAEASDTARYALQGTSIPEYNELNDLHFDEYLDFKTAKVSFKNLPYFNSFNNGREMDEMHYGELLLVNQTKAPKHSTGRYDDDVNIKGWKIVYTKDGKKDSTYVPGRYLPMTVQGHSYTDYAAWLEEHGCPDCCIEDYPEVVGTDATVKVIDCSGNIYSNIVSVNAIFKYHRGDVNIGDDESKYVNETYTINPALTYDASIARYFENGNTLDGTTYTYSCQDLMDGKSDAVYSGPIKIFGNNTFVWFQDTDQSLLSHAMGVMSSELLKYFEKIDRKDFFFAPYDEWDGYKYESRPHTVKVFATGLKPDVEGGTVASIKIFKEQFSKTEGIDDAVYHTNAFMFSAESLDFAKVYVKKGSQEKPIEEYNGAVFGKFIGMSVGDTLVYKVDLDDDYAVQYVEETGLDMTVKYVPYNDVNLVPIVAESWNECFEGTPNIFHHVAQFGATTANNKGWNEFYTFGTTDRGLVTTMNADKVIGSYTSFYSFLTQQFGSCNTCGGGNIPNEYSLNSGSSSENWVPAPNFIYNEMFRKDYKTRYVNTCYPVRDGQFIIAGLNIVDPVDMEVFSNKKGAFEYEVTVLGDMNGEAYGRVDTVGTMVQISPNKYGEVLALVSAKFDPKDRNGLEMTIDTITSGSEKGMWARYYAKDSIRLAPQQHGADVEKYNRVYFFDLDDYKHNLTVNDQRWADLGVWAPYGINVNDTLTAGIKGDVKVPEVWFSSDAAGKNKIDAFQFGVVNGGASKDSVFYIQGRDLPHYGTTVSGEESKIEQEINLLSASDLFTFGTNKAKEVKLFIREKSMELAATAEENPYTFKGGENDLVNNVLRGDVAAKIDVRATPNVEDLCDVENALSLSAVCDVQKDLPLAFTAGLEMPYIKDMEPGDVGGSDARIKWTATPGAQYYQVAVGRFTPKYTSEDVFMSEVRADDASKTIWVELFNATGDVIHRDNKVNYWLEVTKEYTDAAGKPQKEVTKVSVDNFELQGNTQPIDRNWGYAPIAHQMDNMELTTDITKPVKYTIRLMEGFQTDAHQIDIYLFDTPATWMVRKPVPGMPINGGEFNTGDWRTEVGSLPTAYYEWQDDINFDGEESFKVSATSTSIAVHNLIPQTAYTARVRAFNECVGGEEMIPSEDYYDFATSKTATSTGDIYFDEADEHDPVSNESINTTDVTVLGGQGKVTILNAANKNVVISNVLGQTIANTTINSDNVTFNAPAGIVVVVVDGTTVKAVVK
ncbi:MAG: fibronectin type III domain-containing protein [Parabacteroides sp.]|nr:fibronectin type III domain-containing protein [Parabacteroides sp.]